MYTHDIRTIWKLIVINVPIVISWTFLVTPHSLRVLITIEWRIAVYPVFTLKKIVSCAILRKGQTTIIENDLSYGNTGIEVPLLQGVEHKLFVEKWK